MSPDAPRLPSRRPDATRVAVIGIGQTVHARHRIDVDYAELAWEAIAAALADAGIGLLDLDHAVTASLDFVDGRTISNMSTAEVTGSYLKPESRLCGDGTGAVLYARAKMVTGRYRLGLVLAHAKESQGRHHDIENAAFDPFTQRRLGPDGDVVAGLAAQRWYAVSGQSPRDAAAAVVAAREAGRHHPRREALPVVTMPDVLGADPLATPVTTLEKAPLTDGATAMVLATQEMVGELDVDPVWVVGAAAATGGYWTDRDLADTSTLAQARAGAVAMAGWGDAPVHVTELSAQFGHQVRQFSDALGVALDDPGNTPSGGWLAGGAQVVTGMDRVVAAVEQLRGTAGSRQVPDARRALAHGVHGLGAQTHGVVALEAGPVAPGEEVA